MYEPGEQAFRAGVAMANKLYDSACRIADASEPACTEPYWPRRARAVSDLPIHALNILTNKIGASQSRLRRKLTLSA